MKLFLNPHLYFGLMMLGLSSCGFSTKPSAVSNNSAVKTTPTPSGKNITGTNGALTIQIPLGFYDGNETATAIDSNLIAGNIATGVAIFGITGTAAVHGACTDNLLNAAQCTTSASRYVAAALGTNVAGAGTNAGATTTVTLPITGNKFYDGSTSCQLTDANLLAGNIISGKTIFGVPGSAVGAYSACTDNSLNAGQCSTAINRYVTPTLGTNVSGAGSNAGATTTVTLPITGNKYYDGSTSCQLTDANLTSNNILTGKTIFGVSGSVNASYAACTDNALNAGQCSTAINRYVTSTLGANVLGAGSNAGATTTVTLPITGNKFYDGSTSCRLTDANLVPGNIVSGRTIFGVPGSAAGAFGACTDNSLNAGQCSTALNRYVTSTLGSDVLGSGTNAGATTTVTLPITGNKFYDGTTSCKITDANLTAANIAAGVTVFGVLGNAPGPYAACTDNTLNASACSTATNRYVTSTLGANVTGAGSNGGATTTVTLAIPGNTFNDGTTSCQMTDPNLIAGNIASGISIFGVTGNFSGGTFNTLINSGIARNSATTPITLDQEAVTDNNAYPGYRLVPDQSLDSVPNTPILAPNKICGMGMPTLAQAISNCKVTSSPNTWDGTTSGIAGEATWKLVMAYQAGGVNGNACSGGSGSCTYIWQDQRTGLIWSDVINNVNWCMASGNTQNWSAAGAAGPSVSDCDVLNPSAVSLCAEAAGLTLPPSANDARGALTRTSAIRVVWRLPTISDYQLAEYDGIYGPTGGVGQLWTSTPVAGGTSALTALPMSNISTTPHQNTIQARCVGVVH